MKRHKKNIIKIPISFRLGKSHISVHVDDEYCSENKAYGEADFTEKKILLCDKYKGAKIKHSEIEITFYHELVHMILDACKRHNLKYNEDFVDEFSKKLHQFYVSAKYED